MANSSACPYYTHRSAGSFDCTLNEYCGYIQDTYGASDVSCTGSLVGEHVVDETFDTKCFEGKSTGVWYNKGDPYCYSRAYHRVMNGFQSVSSRETLQFDAAGDASGDLLLQYDRTLYQCSGESDWCTCDVSLGNQQCGGCKICGRNDENKLVYEFDCRNLAHNLLFTCEEGNFLDFLFQTSSALLMGNTNPINPPPCDYFEHKEEGEFHCATLDDYCQWINDLESISSVKCSGDLNGQHKIEMRFDRDCQRTEDSGSFYRRNEYYCKQETRTLFADKTETQKWEWAEEYSSALDMLYDHEAYACPSDDPSGDTFCSCRVHLNKRECAVCRVCDLDENFLNMEYDCTNLEADDGESTARLKKTCNGNELDFLFHADEVLPEYDPKDFESEPKDGGPIVVGILLGITGALLLVSLALDCSKISKYSHGHQLWITDCSHFFAFVVWVVCVVSGVFGLGLAFKTMSGHSCRISESVSIYSNCDAEDDDTVAKILILVFFPITYIALVWDFFTSSTRKKLVGISKEESILQYMNRLYAAEPKSLQLKMECFHESWNSSNYFDMNGNLRTNVWLSRIVSHTEKEDVSVVSSTDCSTNKVTEEYLKDLGQNVFEVCVVKTVAGDASYEEQKTNLIRSNETKDEKYTLTEEMNLGRCDASIILYKDLNTTRNDLDICVGVVCHLLVIPAIPYRIWVNSQIAVLKPVVAKRITTVPTAETVADDV